MLSKDKIDKLVEQMKPIFIDENEGKHVTLKTSHSAYRSGTMQFDFDIHVQDMHIVTSGDTMTLRITIACRNATFNDVHWDRECELPEEPILEYYENLTNEEPGKFTFDNIDQIVLSPESCAACEGYDEIDRHKVNRIFDYYADKLNEDSVYNINLSKIIFAEEIEAREKLKAQIKAEEEAAAKKQQRKEKFNKTIDNVKTGAICAGVGVAALAAAPVVIPLAPVIGLSGALAYFVSNLLDDAF